MVKSRVALVTGSTRGIGLAIAHALAREGCNIVLNGFGDPAEIESTRDHIARTYGVKAIYSPADLTKHDEISALVSQVADEFDRIDILINNAGLQHIAPLDEFPVEMWNTMVALNLSAAFHATRLALPFMKARKWGRVVNIVSTHGLVASPYKVPYIATKHGLVGLTKGTAVEAAPWRITCNAIAPGFVDSPMFDVQAEGLARQHGVPKDEVIRRQVREKQPIDRLIAVEEIAAVVVFLSSEQARNITGVVVPVDGGWTAQ